MASEHSSGRRRGRRSRHGDGKHDRWISNCGKAVTHLLEIDHYQPPEYVNHWRREVLGYRQEIYRTLRRHRGMTGQLAKMLAEAWEDRRRDAVDAMAVYDAPDNVTEQASEAGPGRRVFRRDARTPWERSPATTPSTSMPSRESMSGRR